MDLHSVFRIIWDLVSCAKERFVHVFDRVRDSRLVAITMVAVALMPMSPAAWASVRCQSSHHLREGGTAITEQLRYFRGDTDIAEGPEGTTYIRNGVIHYIGEQKQEQVFMPIVNVASHFEILRRQMGPDAIAAMMASRNPERQISQLLQQQIRSTESENLTDLRFEDIQQTVAAFAPHEDLPPPVARQVELALSQMGRHANSLTNWLRPKAVNGRIQQLSPGLITDPIEKDIQAGRIVYKAVLVDVHMDGIHKIILSAGASGAPDFYHRTLIEALLMLVPNVRISRTIPGYIVITPNNPSDPSRGTIAFVTKGEQRRQIVSEAYDFSHLTPLKWGPSLPRSQRRYIEAMD